jgi:hypothetical protein
MRLTLLSFASLCVLNSVFLAVHSANQPGCGDYMDASLFCSEPLFRDFDALRGAATVTAGVQSACTLTLTPVNSSVDWSTFTVSMAAAGATYVPTLTTQLSYGTPAVMQQLTIPDQGQFITMPLTIHSDAFGPSKSMEGEYRLLIDVQLGNAHGLCYFHSSSGDFHFHPATLPAILWVDNTAAGAADTVPPLVQWLNTDKASYRVGDTVSLFMVIDERSALGTSEVLWGPPEGNPVLYCKEGALTWRPASDPVFVTTNCTLIAGPHVKPGMFVVPFIPLIDAAGNQAYVPEFFTNRATIQILAPLVADHTDSRSGRGHRMETSEV